MSPIESTLSLLKKFEKLSRWFSIAGMVFFVLIVLLTFCDVFLRYFFNSPITGVIELTQFLMVIVFFSSAAYAQWNGGNFAMDIVTDKLSSPHRRQLRLVTDIWSLATVVCCVMALLEHAAETELFSSQHFIPIKPFIYFAAFGCAMLCVAIAYETLESTKHVDEQDGRTACAVTLCAALLSTGAAAWFALHRIPGMSMVSLGVIGGIAMFALFFLGMPVAYALIACSFLFISNMRGINAAWSMLGEFWYNTTSNYDWSPMYFFLLMGYICFRGRFGQDLYRAARCWMGHWRGGLAIGSVCSCTAFGAVVGDALSGSITMSAIALPEMRAARYKDPLSIGCLACSGTIGCLIPPSQPFIVYGVLAEQSVGELFMAGLVPGLLCMICFIFIIWLWTRLDPEAAPATPHVPLGEALLSLKSALPIIAIFCLVIGGIYQGVFTTTEGGSIGVTGMLILAVCLGRMNFTNFSAALNESSRNLCVCLSMLAGANLLGSFMTLSRIPMVMANGIAALDCPPILVMLIIIIALCVLGCFIPAMPLMVICIPIFVPIAKIYGWNLVWFGVISILIKNMANITPPFGINLFVLKGLADVPISVMYRASLPYIIGLFLCIALIVMFPQLTLWLPSLMGR